VVYRQYWRFYWPLALMGLAGVLSLQLQNAALARYPDAVTELATFALAQGTFGLFNAALNFVPQLANVFARAPAARERSLRFVLGVSIVFAFIVEALAATAPGAALLTAIYGLDETLRPRVLGWLCLLAPVLIVNGARQFCNGLLIQLRLTGRVTLLNTTYLGSVAVVLFGGFQLGLPAVWTVVGAQGIAGLVHLALGTALVARHHKPPPGGRETPSIAQLARFFAPVATTGIMFAISRPVLYALVARTPEGTVAIAAMRVAFDFTMLFQQAANQFRHFFVTFGLESLPTKRRFMAMVAGGITALMLTVALTPLGDWILIHALGVRGAVRDRALEVVLVMCLLPAIIVARNYFHGILMVRERTGGMAAGGILRVAGIYLLAQTLAVFHALDHVTAAWVLIAGFVIETATVTLGGLRVQRPAIGDAPDTSAAEPRADPETPPHAPAPEHTAAREDQSVIP